MGGVIVLGYHRIADDDDPFGLAVSVPRFVSQIEILARKAHPIPLSDAARALEHGTVPRRAVVITFDDGYRDTVEEALPVIQRAGVPATMFVSTGCLGREFWWHELARLIMDAEVLPRKLELELRGGRHVWTFEAERMESDRLRRAARRSALRSIGEKLQCVTALEREEALRSLRRWAAPHEGDGVRTSRALTGSELRQLAGSPGIEIGAHTVSHPALPALSREHQREEVERSRIDLEAITGKPVTSFSYPHGAYSAETVSVVKEAGFTTACCSEPDVVTRRSNPLLLPRLWPSDQGAGPFSGWLESWLYG